MITRNHPAVDTMSIDDLRAEVRELREELVTESVASYGIIARLVMIQDIAFPRDSKGRLLYSSEYNPALTKEQKDRAIKIFRDRYING